MTPVRGKTGGPVKSGSTPDLPFEPSRLNNDLIGLRQIIDTIPQQIWSATADGAVDFCNARCLSEHGLTLAQAQGDGWQRMLHPDDCERVRKAWRHSVRNGTPYEQLARHRMANGQFRWYLSRSVPLRDEQGRVLRWFGTSTDIEDQQRAEAELRLQLDRLQKLLDVTHRLIARLDVASVIESVLAVLSQREQWEVAEILLPEASTDRLKVYSYLATENLLLAERTVPVDGSLPGHVYRSLKPMIIRSEDLSRLAREFHIGPKVLDQISQRGLATGCILPLIYDHQVLGVLILGATRRREFPDAEVAYVKEIAQNIATVLDHALRFEALNTSNEKLSGQRNCTDEEIRTVFDFEHIIGRSKAMQAVLQEVRTVAPTDSAVLILGETGTGKELIARAIHDRSPRKDQPFIKVDCGAIPASLLESELFGYERGAFTGAISRKLGRLEIADHGTVFLDEIGDLPLELQTKLLRVLQDRAFERLGSNRTVHLDLRVIAATNRDLKERVAKGEFRADLYYRLKVFPIVIPPLRARPDDIPPLVRHYVHKYAQRLKKTIDTIPAHAMQVFKRYPWPGNVRELQHFMERSVVLTSGNILQPPTWALEQELHTGAGLKTTVAKTRTMEEVERETILEALRESRWLVGGPHGAARRLGLKRTTLASRMERLGIARSAGVHRGASPKSA